MGTFPYGSMRKIKSGISGNNCLLIQIIRSLLIHFCVIFKIVNY
ncbi:hypothetical protein KKC1_26910 [Calderihabitans maritimus]|uniref:Uncharacterized protein n=1 Tax=Calderihabitans maritimus TaxID=1246530 RepID=A0A1Z5HWA9_9FIRM|nr:hypothetical protein KKC1_26910 [Calderihabitans maritimus]